MGYAIKIKPGSTVDLSTIDSSANGGITKVEGERKLAVLTAELGELQELFYAAQASSHLTVFQGMDTSGKDGAIRGVFRDVDPQGCTVTSFKAPTPVELAHDFLWRVHLHTPERGLLGVFNRSHYEDVVVVRVHELVPREVWSARYELINAFEKLLVDNGTIINKFYLHIDKAEQKNRLLEREKDVSKAWKLSAGDWKERTYWEKYIEAYEVALSQCSTAHAPWYVIPAENKWFRNLAIAEVLVEQLRPMKATWIETLNARGKAEQIEIIAVRKASGET